MNDCVCICLFFTVLDAAASLLGLDAFRLGDCLTQKFMTLRGEEITTPLTLEQVRRSLGGNWSVKNSHFLLLQSLYLFLHLPSLFLSLSLSLSSLPLSSFLLFLSLLMVVGCRLARFDVDVAICKCVQVDTGEDQCEDPWQAALCHRRNLGHLWVRELSGRTTLSLCTHP